jgi:hypothetical protein
LSDRLAAVEGGQLAAEGEWAPVVAHLLAGGGPSELSGAWTLLSKPGLGRRERWRCEGEGVAYVKRYRRPGLRSQLDRILKQHPRHSMGWWEHAQACRLRESYVAVAESFGAAERMRGWWERASVVALGAAPGEAFDRLWPRLEAAEAPVTRGLARHDVARRLGRFVAALHGTGTCHRDLYLCHVFACLEAAGTTPASFTLIDLARTFRPRLRRMRWVLKDLSQLDYAAQQIGLRRTDRLRCLVAYLGLSPKSPRVRWYVKKVTRRSGRIYRREVRKGRAA